MDARWDVALDSFRDFRVWLHPLASIGDVRKGRATDGVDLSPFLSEGSHSAFEARVTLKWNYELYGTLNQPKPNQILEIQMLQSGKFDVLWIGVIEAVSQFTVARGERSMQLTARSRDSLDQFRTAKRVTPLFPVMTNLGYILRRVAETVNLKDDEVVLPSTSISTAHSNTQLADMSAWEMLEASMIPAGWTPFIDNLGRLRAANRAVQGAEANIILTPERVKRVVANRNRSPVSRVRVKWLNPVLKKSKQQGRMLVPVGVTFGWYLPFWKQTIWFSDDKTQRAENTKMITLVSANALWMPIVKEDYEQLAPNKGRITLINRIWGFTIMLLIGSWSVFIAAKDMHTHPVLTGETGPPLPPGMGKAEAFAMVAIMTIMIAIGNGQYEIWGTPYELAHARNTTEAFDISVPRWVDNPEDVECDFVMDEQHAQAIAVRELVYRAWSANKWQVEIVDDPRVEFGDILEFPDGTKIYVQDFQRAFTRGSEAILQVDGFVLSTTGPVGQVIEGPNPTESPGPGIPGTPGVPGPQPGGPEDPGENKGPLIAPNMQAEVQRTMDEHPELDPVGEGDKGERGEIVNITAQRLGSPPWGRKARRNDPANPNCNTDGLTYMRPDGLFEIYDVVGGGSGAATWQGHGPFEMGENGYWWPPLTY